MSELKPKPKLSPRGELVKKYRENPQSWPDGIDGLPGSGNEQWYRGHEHEWLDDGTYIGPVTKVEDVTKVVVTKVEIGTDVTKVAGEVIERHLGRPTEGEVAMSAAERMRRMRAARKVLGVNAPNTDD